MKTFYQLMLTLLVTLTGQAAFSQTALKMMSNGGPAGNGASNSNQAVTLYDASTSAAYSPTVTATYSFSSQQYGLGTVEGLPSNTGMSFGATLNTNINSPMPATSLYGSMNSIGGATNAMFSSCATCGAGTGMSVSNDNAINLFNCTDALISATTTNLKALNARVYYGDLTITFSRPVSNPIIHLVGLGGTFSISKSGKNYDLGFTTEFDLSGTDVTLSKLSGSTYLNVTATQITNSATWFGSSTTGSSSNGVTRYAASGSVLATGTNITSITLKVYLKGDGGRINNGSSVTTADAGMYTAWSVGATNTMGLSSGSIAGDQYMVGVSLQKPVTVSGNVFNDPNAGNVNNSTGVTNLVPSGMYANLVDANGKTVATAAVATDGTYSFSAIFAGTYTVKLNTTIGVQGANAPAAATPAGWANTGEYNGAANGGTDATVDGTSASFTVGTSNVTNINFGIERLPVSVDLTTLINQPSIGNLITLDGGSNPPVLQGSDADDMPTTGVLTSKAVKITTIPTNTQLYYNGVLVTAGQLISSFNPSLLQIKITSATLGSTSTSFTYAYVDLAGKADPSPATYSIAWSKPLPARLVFSATKNSNSVKLVWEVSFEENVALYQLERSADGISYAPINTQTRDGRTQYTVTDLHPLTGINFYRVRIMDVDGKITYSDIKTAVMGKDESFLMYPNPVRAGGTVTLQLPESWKGTIVNIELYSITGQLVSKQQTQFQGQVQTVDMSRVQSSQYLLRVSNSNGAVQTEKIVVNK